MNHSLQNKRALVTGGSRGIGAAIVKRLARDGDRRQPDARRRLHRLAASRASTARQRRPDAGPRPLRGQQPVTMADSAKAYPRKRKAARQEVADQETALAAS